MLYRRERTKWSHGLNKASHFRLHNYKSRKNHSREHKELIYLYSFQNIVFLSESIGEEVVMEMRGDVVVSLFLQVKLHCIMRERTHSTI